MLGTKFYPQSISLHEFGRAQHVLGVGVSKIQFCVWYHFQ